MVSEQIVEVDGMNRHVEDLRPAWSADDIHDGDRRTDDSAAETHASDVEISTVWNEEPTVQNDDNGAADGADADAVLRRSVRN